MDTQHTKGPCERAAEMLDREHLLIAPPNGGTVAGVPVQQYRAARIIADVTGVPALLAALEEIVERCVERSVGLPSGGFPDHIRDIARRALALARGEEV